MAFKSHFTPTRATPCAPGLNADAESSTGAARSSASSKPRTEAATGTQRISAPDNNALRLAARSSGESTAALANTE